MAVRQQDNLTIRMFKRKLFFIQGLAKLEIALVKGKKLYDKREDLTKKDQKREMERAGKIR